MVVNKKFDKKQKTYSDSGVDGVWFGALLCPWCLVTTLSTGTETLRVYSLFKRTVFCLCP